MDKKMKKGLLKARLIALGVALLMLAAAMGITLSQYYKFKAAYLPFDLTTFIIVNIVGALILYLIVSHFLKKNVKKEYE